MSDNYTQKESGKTHLKEPRVLDLVVHLANVGVADAHRNRLIVRTTILLLELFEQNRDGNTIRGALGVEHDRFVTLGSHCSMSACVSLRVGVVESGERTRRWGSISLEEVGLI